MGSQQDKPHGTVMQMEIFDFLVRGLPMTVTGKRLGMAENNLEALLQIIYQLMSGK